MHTQPLAVWASEAHRLALGKGFWGENPISTASNPNKLADRIVDIELPVKDLGRTAWSGDLDMPCGTADLTREENDVADIFLRLADYCGARGIDLGMVAQKKHEYNKRF